VVPWQRAYHAKDIFLLWGVVLTGQPPRPAERAAMAYLQNAWAAFVLDPHKGLTEFGWPSYSTQGNGK
jgi:carboxylesterase type B